jgi:pimeloyl-ACP methyl ester carboxylesterase
MSEPSQLDRGDGNVVAYHALPGNGPCVVFCGGFMSDMTGTKATALEALCARRGQAFVRFDYLGHGQSSGQFEDGTIGRWADDAIAVLNDVATGPLIIVGSSMGGWIMLLAALAAKDRVKGLIGIAAAPDFTGRMVREEFSDQQRAILARDGRVSISSDYDERPYIITQDLIDDGNKLCLLDAEIDLACPVRLLHGMRDEAVPWQTSMRIMERLTSTDVVVTLVKDGDHRLSEPADIDRLCAAVSELSEL